MAGAIARLVVALREAGIVVHEYPGWEGRGNEGVSQIDPKGAVIHHTATDYGATFPGLASSTRADMRGAVLCNFGGNEDGSLTVVASGLAWHAGGGAGPNLGPLAPYRSRMNFYTAGLEIVYPGDKPMREAQYKTALVFSRVVANLFGGGDIEVVRAHGETNGYGGDGKWDPGHAPGQMIDMTEFRRLAKDAKVGKAADDVLTPNDGNVQMKFKDDTGKVQTGLVAEWWGLAAQRSWDVKQTQVQHGVLLAQIAANTNEDLSAEDILDRVEKGSKEGIQTAVIEVVIPTLTSVLTQLFNDEVERSDEELAKAIVDAMGTRLSPA